MRQKMNKSATALAVVIAISTTASAASARSAPDNPQRPGKAERPAAACATAKEYARIDVAGKGRSSPRRVERIVGTAGERVARERFVGFRWETRKYLQCGSPILHVYVNFKDGRAYYKGGRP